MMSPDKAYSVRIISDIGEWDKLLLLSESPSPFCAAAWIQGISELFAHDFKLLAVEDGEKTLCISCIYFKKRSGQYFSFHPSLTPYNSPQFIKPEKIAVQRWEKVKFNVLTALQEYLRNHFIYPYLFLDTVLKDVRPFTWNNWNVRPAYTFCVDPSTAKMDADIPRRARNCLKEGYHVSYDWQPEVFVKLFRMTMDRQKISLHFSDEKLTEFLIKLHAGKLIWMITSYDADQNPHASWVQLQIHQDMVFNWNSATNLQFANSGGTSLLVYELMEHLKMMNVRKWDLCGADNPSVSGFKANLGGELIVYYKADFSNYPLQKKIYLRCLNRGK